MNNNEYPSWVTWLAQDADGAWWGFECEPNEYDYGWYENEVGRSIKVRNGSNNLDWRNSLQKISSD